AAALVDAAAARRERPPRLETFRRPGPRAVQPRQDETDLFPQQGRTPQARRIENGAAPAGRVAGAPGELGALTPPRPAAVRLLFPSARGSAKNLASSEYLPLGSGAKPRNNQ